MTWILRTGNSAEFDPEAETESCPPRVSGSAVYQSSQYPAGTENVSEIFPDWPLTVISVVKFELPGNRDAVVAVAWAVVMAAIRLPEVGGGIA